MTSSSYASDLSDAEWEILAPLLCPRQQAGHPQVFALRRIVEAVFYLLRTGCQWRALPHDFPPWTAVFYHYAKWRRRGTWERINTALREQHRVATGRKAQPTAPSSTASQSAPPRPAVRAATTAARRSLVANATFWSTLKVACSKHVCTPPTSMTAVAHRCCSLASTPSSPASP